MLDFKSVKLSCLFCCKQVHSWLIEKFNATMLSPSSTLTKISLKILTEPCLTSHALIENSWTGTSDLVYMKSYLFYIWAVLCKKVPNGLSRCHTKRRWARVAAPALLLV